MIGHLGETQKDKYTPDAPKYFSFKNISKFLKKKKKVLENVLIVFKSLINTLGLKKN